MAMDIKRDEPLSPEARRYLIDLNRHDLIAQVDEAHPPAEEPNVEAQASVDGWRPVTGLETLSDADLQEELDRRRSVADTFSAPGAGTDEAPYEEWTHAELDEELAVRRDADGKPLAKTGNVQQKANRLRSHDGWLATQSPI